LVKDDDWAGVAQGIEKRWIPKVHASSEVDVHNKGSTSRAAEAAVGEFDAIGRVDVLGLCCLCGRHDW
jgi:hypothetical protein